MAFVESPSVRYLPHVFRSGCRRTLPALATLLLAAMSDVPALSSDSTSAQYDITAWTGKDGIPGLVTSLAQTSDGYLWLATSGGLVRFDGVRFVTWKPRSGQAAPWGHVWSLCASRDGSLWVGAYSGIVGRIRDGELKIYTKADGLAGGIVQNLVETHSGVIWAATQDALYRLKQNHWVRYGPAEGVPNGMIVSLVEARDSVLWAATLGHVLYLIPGSERFADSQIRHVGTWPALSVGSDGSVYLSNASDSTIRPIVHGRAGSKLAIPPVTARMILQTGPQEFWLPNVGQGVIWLHGSDSRGRLLLKQFRQSDGLPDDNALYALRDREGNIWVSCKGGLVRFRKRKFAILSPGDGLPDRSTGLIAQDGQGALWTTTHEGLAQIGGDSKHVVAANRGVESISRGRSGTLWVGADAGVARFWRRRLYWINRDLRFVNAIAEDSEGTLWLADWVTGVWKWQAGKWISLRNEPVITGNSADKVFADSKGRVWIALSAGGMVVRENGRFRRCSEAEGFSAGQVRAFLEDHTGAIWLGGDRGLSRLVNGRFQTLGSGNGLPAGPISGILEDKQGSLWVAVSQGIVRIRRADLDRAQSVSDPTPYRLFDAADGLASYPVISTETGAIRTSGGSLWFTVTNGFVVINPDQISENTLLPPVHIETAAVDGNAFEAASGLRLGPNPKQFRFEYTALSLAASEKVLFRYKLEPYDADWQNVGTRRWAFYNDLRPGNYRFRVVACNNDGIWNEAGATIAFSIQPTFVQTTAFQLLCAALAAVVLWGVYRLRVRQIAARLNLRFEERLGERTRIARELHDTLLQSFQGLMLRLQTVEDLLPLRPAEAKQVLETTLERADEAIAEGRDAVQDLRSSTAITNDLGHSLRSLGQDLSTGNGNSTAFEMLVEGTPRDLHPILRDEVYRIGREALQNAFRHARASHVEAEITYEPKLFRLRVRDDGHGIEPEILDTGERRGHWGLQGMRERAERIGARMDIWSRPSAGTEIELSVPGPVAYGTAPGRDRWWRSRKQITKA